MTKDDIKFITLSDRFVVLKDGKETEFGDWLSAAKFYNENLSSAIKTIELSALNGMVGRTIKYHHKL